MTPPTVLKSISDILSLMQKVGKFEAGGRMYRIDQEIKQKDFDDAISKLSNKKRKVNINVAPRLSPEEYEQLDKGFVAEPGSKIDIAKKAAAQAPSKTGRRKNF